MRRDELECGGEFVDGTEGVACAVDEESLGCELREMGRAQFVRAARWMERIGEQQEAVDEAWFGSGEHGGLTSPVGMAAEEDVACRLAAHRGEGGLDSLLIAFCASARWRAVRARLAEGQIAAEDCDARVAECGREGNEERGVAIGSGAVGEDKSVAGRIGGEMQEAANGRGVWRIGGEFSDFIHILQPMIEASER